MGILTTRFTIVEPDREWADCNWRQCYSETSLREELAEAGFRVSALYGDLKGTPVSETAMLYGVLTEPV